MPSPRFPAGPDEVGPEWFTEALATTGTIAEGARVTAVDTEQIGVGVGILALLWRCRFTYDRPGAGPDSAVLKLPALAEHSRQLSDAFKFYEREVRFYEVVGHATPITTADRYYTDFDPESGDFVLLMEDFGRRRLLDQIAGASPEDSVESITALAAHHAAWWDHASFGTDAMAWAPRVIDPPNPQALVPSLKASWPIVEERFGEHLGAFREAAARMSDACVPLMDQLSQPPITLVHGDHRLDNIFHPVEDGQEVAVVDWQICGLGRGVYDVAYYMSQSLRSEVRAECERDVVRAYHDRLVADGVTGYSFDDAWTDYRRATLFCSVYPLNVGSVDLANERAVELFTLMLSRSVAAIVDLDAMELMPG